jgi:hypothetical protein
VKESVELDLSVSSTFFTDLENRLAASADRFAAKMQTAGRAASTSGAGAPGASPPGGGSSASGFGGRVSELAGGGALGGTLGFAANAGLAGVQAAGASIRNLPMGQVGTEAGFSRAARAGIGGALDATVGKVPVLGDLIMASYNKMQSAIDQPEQEAIGRLGGYYAQLDAAGVHVDEATRRSSFKRAIQFGRVKWESMRESERIAGEVNLSMRPAMFALNQWGK